MCSGLEREDGSFLQFNHEENQIICNITKPFVWMGQRSQKCGLATQTLIQLVGSKKYRTLICNKKHKKVKVWEMIAADVEAKGFKVANNIIKAGERTCQHWRNMEKKYWIYRKKLQDDPDNMSGKKPFCFYNDIDSIISKQSDFKKKLERLSSSRSEKNRNVFRITKEVTNMLIYLARTKYQSLLNGTQNRKHIFWKSIYDDISGTGVKFANSRKHGVEKLRRKWKIIKQTGQHEEIPGPNSPGISRLLESLNPNKRESSTSDYFMNTRKQKGLTATEALVQLVASEIYNSSNTIENLLSVWKQIYYRMNEMGFHINGDTDEAKSNRLYNKWIQMKNMFLKYVKNKSVGAKDKKPEHYDLIKKMIGEKIIKNVITDSDNRSISIQQSDNPPASITVPNEEQHNNNINNPTSPSQTKPTTNQQSALTDMLQQIKCLHERSLSLQEQHNTRVISLLEKQINQQQILNSLVTKMVSEKTTGSKSHKKHSNDKEPKLFSPTDPIDKNLINNIIYDNNF